MTLKFKLPNLQENILLANFTTFRIGGAARYFVVVKSRDEFVEAIRAAKENGTPFYVLGGGSNLLVADKGFDGLVIQIQNKEIRVQSDKEKCEIECEAGVPLGRIILETSKSGYSGAEWGFGIPGTIGGAICGNAGRLGRDISGVVKEVTILDRNLDEKQLSKQECDFAYRESRFKKTEEVILGASLEFKKSESAAIEQTLNEAKAVIKKSPPFPSAGCVFKNYQVKLTDASGGSQSDQLLQNHPELTERIRGGKLGVGHLIDQCGLKGQQVGGAQIWPLHANYIINVGGASAKHVLTLVGLCQEKVKAKYGIDLKEEIRLVGF